MQKAQDLYYEHFNLLKFIVNKSLPEAKKTGLNILREDAGNLRGPLKELKEGEVNKLREML